MEHSARPDEPADVGGDVDDLIEDIGPEWRGVIDMELAATTFDDLDQLLPPPPFAPPTQTDPGRPTETEQPGIP